MKSDLFIEKVADSIIKRNPNLNFENVLKDIRDIFLNDSAWLKVLNQIDKLQK